MTKYLHVIASGHTKWVPGIRILQNMYACTCIIYVIESVYHNYRSPTLLLFIIHVQAVKVDILLSSKYLNCYNFSQEEQLLSRSMNTLKS